MALPVILCVFRAAASGSRGWREKVSRESLPRQALLLGRDPLAVIISRGATFPW